MSWRRWFTDMRNWVYKEGVWTPTFTGLTVGGVGGTVTHYGRYYKIGNMVHLMGQSVTNVTGTLSCTWGVTAITNLPFPIDYSIARGATRPYWHSIGSVINDSLGTYLAPMVVSHYDLANELRAYMGTFGPTTASHNLTWSCWLS